MTLKQSFAELAEKPAKWLDATVWLPIDCEETRLKCSRPRDGNDSNTLDDSWRFDIVVKPKVTVLGSEMTAEQEKTNELKLETTFTCLVSLTICPAV